MTIITRHLKNESNLVFDNVAEGVYKVEKDRDGRFSGAVYLTSEEVVNALNNYFKISIYKNDRFVHANFKTELVISESYGILIAAKD